MSRVSLRARITLMVIGLFAIVVAALAVATGFALRSYLTGDLDEDLAGSTNRALSALDGPYRPAPGDAVGLPGQAPGTLAAFISDGSLLLAGVLDQSGETSPLSDAQRLALSTAIDGQPVSMPFSAGVGDLGGYRLIGVRLSGGGILVMGLAESRVDSVVGQYWWLASAVGGGVLVVAGVGAWFMAAALQRTLGRLSSALAAREASEDRLRRFVADASHELRTPLASIRGYAELTRRSGARVRKDVAHSLDRIEAESVRMTGLVEDLLLLARLDALEASDGAGSILAAPVDLTQLVGVAVGDAQVSSPDHDWSVEIPDAPVVVDGEEPRLHQAVANLLRNAAVHTPPGTAVVARVLPPGADVGVAVIEIEDDGPGIPEELLARVFGRFVRGDASRSRAAGSTGLGLAIVRAVVGAHGGTAEVESAVGRTVFRLRLPLPPPSRSPDN